jgi:hypothetical protein
MEEPRALPGEQGASPAREAPASDRPSRHAGPGRLAAWSSRVSPERWFAAAFLVALAALAAVYLLVVATERGQSIENLALRGAEFRSVAEREAAIERLAQLSVGLFAASIAIVLLVGLIGRRPAMGIVVGLVMGASVVATELLKDVLPRPALVEGPAWLLRNSFPSGTAAVAAAMAVGAILMSPDRLRWAVVPIGAAYTAIVADAVQTTGWHRLSDAVGGVLVVVAVFSAALAVIARAGSIVRSEHGRIDRRVRLLVIGLAAAAVAIGAVVLAIAAAFPLLTTPTGGRRVFLQTAFPLIGAGLVVAVIVVFARVVEPFTFGRRADSAPVEAGRRHDPPDPEVAGGPTGRPRETG